MSVGSTAANSDLPQIVIENSTSGGDNPNSLDLNGLKKAWDSAKDIFEELQKLSPSFSSSKKTHKNKVVQKKTKSDGGMLKPVMKNGGTITQGAGLGTSVGAVIATFDKLDLWVQVVLISSLVVIAAGAVATSLYNRRVQVLKQQEMDLNKANAQHSSLASEARQCKKISKVASTVITSQNLKELDERLSSLDLVCNKLSKNILDIDVSKEVGYLKGKYKSAIDNNDVTPETFAAAQHEVLAKLINPLTSQLSVIKDKYSGEKTSSAKSETKDFVAIDINE